jgi:hypothetical protein
VTKKKALFWLGGWPVAAAWYFSLVTSFMMFFRLRLEHQGTDCVIVRSSSHQGATLRTTGIVIDFPGLADWMTLISPT